MKNIFKPNKENAVSIAIITAVCLIFLFMLSSMMYRIYKYDPSQIIKSERKMINETKELLKNASFEKYYNILKETDGNNLSQDNIANQNDIIREYPFNSIVAKEEYFFDTILIKFIYSELKPAINTYYEKFNKYPLKSDSTVIDLGLLKGYLSIKDNKLNSLTYKYDKKTNKISIFSNEKRISINLIDLNSLKVKKVSDTKCTITYDGSKEITLNLKEELLNIRLEQISKNKKSVVFYDTVRNKAKEVSY